MLWSTVLKSRTTLIDLAAAFKREKVLKMAIVWKLFSCGSVFFFYRDSAEDPLDDSGTVQQQLDQVTYMIIYQ